MEKNLKFELSPINQERINRLSGPTNSTYKQIEKELDIKIISRGENFKIQGSKNNIKVTTSDDIAMVKSIIKEKK